LLTIGYKIIVFLTQT